jgi:hypothetical protein
MRGRKAAYGLPFFFESSYSSLKASVSAELTRRLMATPRDFTSARAAEPALFPSAHRTRVRAEAMLFNLLLYRFGLVTN